ncbi:MAG: rRNA maturation RNase YbeY [Cyclobacteriaceae bacterium]
MIHFFIEDVSFDPAVLEATPNWLLQVANIHFQSIDIVNYIFCSDQYLLQINQQHLNHDYFTDIITFDLREDNAQPIESDIFISTERVLENSAQMSTSFLAELLRVMVHGILHLLGFDDHSENDRQIMRTLEEEYLKLYFTQFHPSL